MILSVSFLAIILARKMHLALPKYCKLKLIFIYLFQLFHISSLFYFYIFNMFF
jgi:hypothetical protein